MPPSRYTSQVFVNCPFDEAYRDVFRAIVFAILDSGFIPRCTLEFAGSQVRLNHIVALIEESKYGIHDISRVALDAVNQLPRFNMPFELGLFTGAQYICGSEHRQKSALLLEKEQYRYQIYLSDVAGMDIRPHNESPVEAIRAVRDWLASTSRRTTIPDGGEIGARFQTFTTEFVAACEEHGIDHERIAFGDLIQNMTDWLQLNRVVTKPLFGA